VAAIGGIAIGCLIGFAVMEIHKRLDDPVIETVVTMLTPFILFIVFVVILGTLVVQGASLP